MIIKETKFYKTIAETPWSTIGESYCDNDINYLCSHYPKLFSKIYEFETGEQIIQGDNIWRIAQKRFVKEVKCVQFLPQNHLTLDIFPSYEIANTELDKINANLGLLHKDKNILTILSQVKLFSNTNNLDELTFKELTRRIENINGLVKDI